MPRRGPPEPLGMLLVALGAASLLWLPFLMRKPNRIMPGVPHALFEVLPPAHAAAVLALLVLAALAALFISSARLRLLAALLALVATALALASGADVLTHAGNAVVRVAPGAGFWLLFMALGLLAADAVSRLAPSPPLRVLLLVAALAVALLGLSGGTFDNLSIMREYAVNPERFGRELRTHLLLALGSLGAATVVAVPLGILVFRRRRLRAVVLAALNLVQTIPSIALFGILMAPLGALAVAAPWAAALGIRGIGAAPAVIALFLYSLLPVVANTAAGLARVPEETVEAARGMGMSAGQVLAYIELPLALPVVLTGIRIVTVQNLGLVAVAALIGAGGLGAFVFQGIGQSATDLVLLGAIPIVVLAFAAAVLLDALVEMLDRMPGSERAAAAGGAAA